MGIHRVGFTLGSPFSHSLRAICTALLDPRDPLLQSEWTQGFTVNPVYGRAKCLSMLGEIKTLKDLKDGRAKRDPKASMLSLQSFLREGRVVGPCWEQLKPQRTTLAANLT